MAGAQAVPSQKKREGRQPPTMGGESLGNRRARVLVIVTIFIFHAVGLYLFTDGFLLTRQELPVRSQCHLRPRQFSRSSSSGRSLNASTVDTNEERTSKYLPENNKGASERGCWMGNKYDRVVLMIVDALRFDFAYFNHTKPSKEENSSQYFFRNKLGVIHELIQKTPSKARLFKFMADPPTVTMQRLKGITTGGLPTFIDIKNNFASAAIDEDNIISQFSSLNKRVVMMGDDTWASLFPDDLAEAYPYPSFNVKDLHTVDNGVLEHLMPTIRAGNRARGSANKRANDVAAEDKEGDGGDWDVLIAHFLGVDHVGHRYGPSHEWMTRKLDQMDAVMGQIIKEIDNSAPITTRSIPSFSNPEDSPTSHAEAATEEQQDHQQQQEEELPTADRLQRGQAVEARGSPARTLVLVLGDHGMTADGNHGGASEEETAAGLFVYSSTPVFDRHIALPGRSDLDRTKLWIGEQVAPSTLLYSYSPLSALSYTPPPPPPPASLRPSRRSQRASPTSGYYTLPITHPV